MRGLIIGGTGAFSGRVTEAVGGGGERGEGSTERGGGGSLFRADHRGGCAAGRAGDALQPGAAAVAGGGAGAGARGGAGRAAGARGGVSGVPAGGGDRFDLYA